MTSDSVRMTSLLHRHPALFEWYIRWKEDHGEDAVRQSSVNVTDSEERFIHQFGGLINKLEAETEFYEHGFDTLEECRARVGFLKAEIEDNGAYRLSIMEASQSSESLTYRSFLD